MLLGLLCKIGHVLNFSVDHLIPGVDLVGSLPETAYVLTGSSYKLNWGTLLSLQVLIIHF